MVCSKSLQVFLGLRSAHCAKCAGAGRVGGDNGASPQEAPPDIRYRAQCCSREVRRGGSAVWLLALGRHQLLLEVAHVSSQCLCLAGRLEGRCGDHDCLGRRTQVQRRRCATQGVSLALLCPASAETCCWRRPRQPQHLLDQLGAAQGAHLACALPGSCLAAQLAYQAGPPSPLSDCNRWPCAQEHRPGGWLTALCSCGRAAWAASSWAARRGGAGLSRGAARLQDYEPPSGELLDAIERDFGSLDDMVSKFNPKTAAVQAPPPRPARWKS